MILKQARSAAVAEVIELSWNEPGDLSSVDGAGLEQRPAQSDPFEPLETGAHTGGVSSLAVVGGTSGDDFIHRAGDARVAPPGSEIADSTRSSIEEAKQRAGIATTAAKGPAPAPAPAASGGASVSGIVEVAPGVAAKIAPTDTLFVFARAAEGPRMPVAILKVQAKDLPLRFTLDDRSAMTADAKLSDQKRVIVGARVSKTGSATPQPGDLQGYSEPVAPGASGIRIVLSDAAK